MWKFTVYIYGHDLEYIFVLFFCVWKSQSIFGFVIKGQKKDRFHKDACFLLACERRHICGCCLSPPIITPLFSVETSDSRKYVCVHRLFHLLFVRVHPTLTTKNGGISSSAPYCKVKRFLDLNTLSDSTSCKCIWKFVSIRQRNPPHSVYSCYVKIWLTCLKTT